MNKVTLQLTDEQLARIQKMLADEPVPTGVRWRAEEGGKNWFVAGCGVALTSVDTGHSVDNYRYDTGNYYKTKDEAVVAEKKQSAMQKIFDYIAKGNAKKGWVADWHDEMQSKYHATYDHQNKELWFSWNHFIQAVDPRLYGHVDVIEQSIIDLESEYLIYFQDSEYLVLE